MRPRLFVRGKVNSLGSDCIEKPLRDEHKEQLGKLLEEAGLDGQVDPSEFRRYGSARSSTTSTWTIWGRIDGRRNSLGAHAAAHLRDLRRIFDRGDPPRRRDRHLRHSRLRRQAQGPAFRRSVVSRRLDQPLSARRLPREMRDRRDAWHALRQEADPSENPDHHRRHELRRRCRARPRRRSAAAPRSWAPPPRPATAA